MLQPLLRELLSGQYLTGYQQHLLRSEPIRIKMYACPQPDACTDPVCGSEAPWRQRSRMLDLADLDTALPACRHLQLLRHPVTCDDDLGDPLTDLGDATFDLTRSPATSQLKYPVTCVMTWRTVAFAAHRLRRAAPRGAAALVQTAQDQVADILGSRDHDLACIEAFDTPGMSVVGTDCSAWRALVTQLRHNRGVRSATETALLHDRWRALMEQGRWSWVQIPQQRAAWSDTHAGTSHRWDLDHPQFAIIPEGRVVNSGVTYLESFTGHAAAAAAWDEFGAHQMARIASLAADTEQPFPVLRSAFTATSV